MGLQLFVWRVIQSLINSSTKNTVFQGLPTVNLLLPTLRVRCSGDRPACASGGRTAGSFPKAPTRPFPPAQTFQFRLVACCKSTNSSQHTQGRARAPWASAKAWGRVLPSVVLSPLRVRSGFAGRPSLAGLPLQPAASAKLLSGSRVHRNAHLLIPRTWRLPAAAAAWSSAGAVTASLVCIVGLWGTESVSRGVKASSGLSKTRWVYNGHNNAS